MRRSQPMGRSFEADRFLAENAKRRNICSSCGRDDGFVSKKIGEYGMFDDCSLFEYELKDGHTAREAIQYELWSSGPMTWIELRVSDGTVFRWNKGEIDPEGQECELEEYGDDDEPRQDDQEDDRILG